MAITLTGPFSVLEGGLAGDYTVALDSVTTLAAGSSVVFSLQVIAGTASAGLDYSDLQLPNFSAAANVSVVSVATSGNQLTFTVRATAALAGSASLLIFKVRTGADKSAEPDETFTVQISSPDGVTGSASVSTTIINQFGTIDVNTDAVRWSLLNGDSITYQGIAGTEVTPIVVTTGTNITTGFEANNVSLSDAITFATLNTGIGDDQISILVTPRQDTPYVQFGHGAYKATINTGDGNDVVNVQSVENVGYVRVTPQDIPSYTRPDYYDSIVDAGTGNDYVYAFLPYKTQFLGGDGVDTIFFYGRFSDWTYQTVDVGNDGLNITLSDNASDYAIWSATTSISNTAINNSVRGFEFIQFNDILLDVREALSLSGTTTVAEGASASYAVNLVGDGLQSGHSVSFTLQLSSGTASISSDLAALTASALQGAAGITLQNVTVDAANGVIRAVATASRTVVNGEVIARLTLPVLADAVVEGDELYTATLSGFVQQQTGVTTVDTTISGNANPLLRISGPATVVQEGLTGPYTVSLAAAVALPKGQSVTFTLDTTSGTAGEGFDFTALAAGDLQPSASGLTLTRTTAVDGSGVITVTVRNDSGVDLATGSALVSFGISTTKDGEREASETLDVTLFDGNVITTLTTTIKDNNPALRLIGPASVLEASATTPYSVLMGSGVVLAKGQSVTFTVDTSSGTATEGVDFTALSGSAITAATGITLSKSAPDASGVITVTATNSSGADLAAGADLASFVITSSNDVLVEGDETYAVSLGAGSGLTIEGAAVVTTTITDNDAPAVRLSGPTTVAEGLTASPYTVSLGAGVGLGKGQSVTFTLDTASGTAGEGVDVAALLEGTITAAAGLTLARSTALDGSGVVTVTATNSGTADLAAGAALASFGLATTNDVLVEGAETYQVTIGAGSGAGAASVEGTAALTTTITDNDTATVRLSGPATVTEGSATTPYTVSLGAGVGLGRGQSVSFTVDTASGSAVEGTDFAALLAADISGVGAVAVTTSTGANGVITVTATNNGTTDLAAGAALASFSLNTSADPVVEGNETYSVVLGGGVGVTVEGSTTLATTITEATTPSVRISGPGVVSEGANSSAYQVSMGNAVVLGRSQSVTFTLDTSSGTATEAVDFTALSPTAVTAATGVMLSKSAPDASGVITVTATNISGADLIAGAELANFTIKTSTDVLVEGDESYGVILGAGTGVGLEGAAVLTTAISDDDVARVRLSGPFSTLEGELAGDYTVALDSGTTLAAGDSFVFTLQALAGSALPGRDYSDIQLPDITAATNVDISSVVAIGNLLLLTVRATEDLAVSSSLLTFKVRTAADQSAEPDESFSVQITSPIGIAGPSSVVTTIASQFGIVDADTNAVRWTTLNGDTITYEGIAGTEATPITVTTGLNISKLTFDNDVSLSDAIAFATVNTGDGNDQIVVLVTASPPGRDSSEVQSYVQFGHGAYKSVISTGDGNDRVNVQSVANTTYVRATPQDIPTYSLPDYYDSIVDAGAGDDYVYAFLPYKTQFLGGAGEDTLFFYGRFSDWTYQIVDVGSNGLDITLGDNATDFAIWNASTAISSTAINNTVRGFEFIQFNDILLDAREDLTLTGPLDPVAEGATAAYAVRLSGNGLRSGNSVLFTLQLSGGTASLADLAPLAASALQAAGGVVLQNVTVEAATGLIRAVATASRDLAASEAIASLSLAVQTDLIVEGDELVSLSLGGFVQPQTLTTTITDTNSARVRLSGPVALSEGGVSAPYTVSLGVGDGLAAGRSVTFRLDMASGTATQGSDFTALVAAAITAATGLTLSTSDGANGGVTVTAINSSGADLLPGSPLVRWSLASIGDAVVEGDETVLVSLASSSATVEGPSLITTTILDDDAPSVRLSGPSSVQEGGIAAAYGVSLGAGFGLGAGRSLRFSLDSASGTASEGLDFTALAATDILGINGVTVSTSTGSGGVVTVTARNDGALDLEPGAMLATFAITTTTDTQLELDETLQVLLAAVDGGGAVVSGAPSLSTTIVDSNAPSLRLAGPAAVVEGASSAPYAMSLGSGVGLSAGRSISFRLACLAGSAGEGVDVQALKDATITAPAGVSLSRSSAADGTLMLTATNSSAVDLPAGSLLASLVLSTSNDAVVETAEDFTIRLSAPAGVAVEGAGSVQTTIQDNDLASLRLSGPTSVQEGATTSPYAVAMSPVASLGAGRSVSFTVATAPGSAGQGADFTPLLATDIQVADGLALISTNTGEGVATVTVTNTSGTDLSAGAALVSFGVGTSPDSVAEAAETFAVELTGLSGAVVDGASRLTTSILNRGGVVSLAGPASVQPGQTTTPYLVSLAGSPLAARASISVRLDSLGLTAVEGVDVLPLSAADLTPATGVGLSVLATDPATGAIDLRITNTGSQPLPTGSALLRFALATTAMAVAGDAFAVTLTLGTGSAQAQAAVQTRISEPWELPVSSGAQTPTALSGGGYFITADPLINAVRFLTGSPFDDVIFGGRGSDLIVGGGGADRLMGDQGSDVFQLAYGDPDVDTITDFRPAADRLQIDGVPRSSPLGRSLRGASQSRSILSTVRGASKVGAARSYYVYDSLSGALYFNANLSRSGFGPEGGQIAQLTPGLVITGNDLQFSFAPVSL